jgi:PAS domain S-box-containing protein
MIQVQQKSDLFEALQAAGDGALAATPDGRILLWNRAAERLLGYTSEEAVGRSCWDLLSGRAVTGERVFTRECPVRNAAARGQAVESFDMRSRTKNGQPIWLNVSTLSLRRVADGESVTIHLFRPVAPKPERPEATVTAPAPLTPESGDSLTRREREVLKLLAAGANTRVLAERLGISPATVRNHVQNLFGKLGVHSRLEAVAYANAHRLL